MGFLRKIMLYHSAITIPTLIEGVILVLSMHFCSAFDQDIVTKSETDFYPINFLWLVPENPVSSRCLHGTVLLVSKLKIVTQLLSFYLCNESLRSPQYNRERPLTTQIYFQLGIRKTFDILKWHTERCYDFPFLSLPQTMHSNWK